MKLYILGAGTPRPSPDRFGSAYVVKVGGDHIMFDCGPATTHKLSKAGLSPVDIDYLLFTHHHYDHDVDYPCFLLSRWNLHVGDENELQVFGPALTEQLHHRLMDEHEGAFAHDWIARINHPLSLNAYTSRGGVLPRPEPSFSVSDIGPGKVVQGSSWEITAAPAEHVEPWLDSLAYRVDSDEGSIVVTGDTRACQSVTDLATDADMLVCICVDVEEDVAGTAEADYMCHSETAAEMARDAGAKSLVLVHQAFSLDAPGQTERALADLTRIYDGRVVWGEELMVLDV